jgi:hypothetical protein
MNRHIQSAFSTTLTVAAETLNFVRQQEQGRDNMRVERCSGRAAQGTGQRQKGQGMAGRFATII